MTDERQALLKSIKKGGMTEGVKAWMDRWVWQGAWNTLNQLVYAEPTRLNLLEVRAQAKMILELIEAVQGELTVAEIAAGKLKTAVVPESED